MRDQTRLVVTAAAALLVGAAALAPLALEPVRAHEGHHHAPAAPEAGGTATPAAPPVRNRWRGNYFPNVELVTQHGTKVRLYDDLLKDKTVAINVFFAECPDVCPLITAKLVELRSILGERVGRDIVFYSISIDPERDTPEALKAYAERFGVEPDSDWLFLTGKPADIRLATRRLGLVRGTDKATRDGHSTILVVGDEPNGVWSRTATTDSTDFVALRIASILGWRELPAPAQSYAEARPLTFKEGEDVFQSFCGTCHTIGGGDKIGPDLRDVTLRRERAWLARYIRVPDRVRAEGDPIAAALFKQYNEIRMPNLYLTREQAVGVISYLEARSSAPREQRAGKDSGRRHAD